MLEIAMITNVVVSSPIGPAGFFFIQGGITLLGGIFVFCFVKETQGLNDFRKKNLYSPVSVNKVSNDPDITEMELGKTEKNEINEIDD